MGLASRWRERKKQSWVDCRTRRVGEGKVCGVGGSLRRFDRKGVHLPDGILRACIESALEVWTRKPNTQNKGKDMSGGKGRGEDGKRLTICSFIGDIFPQRLAGSNTPNLGSSFGCWVHIKARTRSKLTILPPQAKGMFLRVGSLLCTTWVSIS